MSNTITLYRGTHSANSDYWAVGACWTTDREAADRYGDHVVEWEVDLDALTVLDAPAYDAQEDWAPGDTAADCAAWAGRGADLIRYDDADDRGWAVTTTYRIVRNLGEMVQ